MIHGVIDPTFLSGLILFQLVSIKSQLITTSIRFQGSTILRLWNPRSNDSNRIRTNLERLTLHNSGTRLISLRSSDDWPRRPRVSCLYAVQIGAQCQVLPFPPFFVHPGWLSKKARQLASHALGSCSSFPSLGCG